MGIAILINIIWIFLGYLVGSFNFSIILTNHSSSKENIREVGSKNAGATNALRSYGWKFGLLIFILDASKSFWFAFSAGMLQNHVYQFQSLIPQLATLFVIVGHIFPLFFQFKGGKGAASLLGMIASISIILAAIGTIIFLIVVSYSKYVSLGSIVVPYILVMLSLINPYLNGWWDSAIQYGPYWVSTITLLAGCIIVTISHKQNIINLIQKKERKLSFKKSHNNEQSTN